MCLFIYTLPQLCNHLCFQNVSECAVARGIPPTDKSCLTLQEPVFLFDTMRSNSRTPKYYSQRFACKKRKAVRPVPTLCEQCGSGAAAVATTMAPSLRTGRHTDRHMVSESSPVMSSSDERSLLAAKISDRSWGRSSQSSGM